MNKFRIVCEKANIGLRGAQKMEKENLPRFNYIQCAGYCDMLGLDLPALESYFNAGVTNKEIEQAIILYRLQKKFPNLHSSNSEESDKEIATILDRVNMQLEEYEINGYSAYIVNAENLEFELNFKDNANGSSIFKKYSIFYDNNCFLDKPSIKTVTYLTNEILESLKSSGYKIRNVNFIKKD